MAQGKVYAKWVEGDMFIGADRYGNPIPIGAATGRDPKWTGVKPSDLLMIGMICCSGYDVVTILQKQRQQLTGFEVSAIGDQDDDPPYVFTKIEIEYIFRGRNLNEAFIQRAIDLSENQYCSVMATIRPNVQITTHYRIEEA